VILEKWGRYIPPAQILRVSDPASIVEVMLGAMALKRGKMDLDSFVANMKERRVAKATRDDVYEALAVFAQSGVIQSVDASLFS
jgi:Ca2+-binding EF-hand superfamily protein